MIRTLALLILCCTTFSITALAETKDRFLDIREITSPGGIKAWLVEDHSVPLIAVQMAFVGAGSTRDPDDKQGLAQLLSNTLDEGAGDLDSQSFQKRLADHSISLSYNVGRDDFYGYVKMLSREKDLAFDMLRLSLTAPRFDADAVNRMRAANISRIRTSLSDPEWMAARLLNDRAYAGHPYARNSGGTLTSLPSITPDDLRHFAKTELSRDRLHIAVAGDITAVELGKYLDAAFGPLPATAPANPTPDITVQNGGTIALFEKDIPQTIIEMTQPGIRRDDPDWQTAQVMNFILGSSGFGSRLMEEVREKRGLTYGIYTSYYALDHVPTLTLSTSTRNDKAAEVLGLIDSEWKRMVETDITAAELQDAKDYLVGSMPLALTSTDSIAQTAIGVMLDGLPIDYLDTVDAKINAVTIADVRRVAGRILTPGQMTVVLVGKPDSITPTLKVESLPNVD